HRPSPEFGCEGQKVPESIEAMAAQDRHTPFYPETDLADRGARHGDMIEREQQRVAKGSARDHGVAIDAVVADALPRAGEQSDVGALGELLGVAVDGQPLPVRDTRMRVFE